LVDRIDKRFLIRFIKQLHDEELSFSYISTTKSILNQTLKYVVYLDYIDNNPLSAVNLEKNDNYDSNSVVEKYLTYEEADRVGHSDPDTTLKIYNHVTSKQKATITEKLNLL